MWSVQYTVQANPDVQEWPAQYTIPDNPDVYRRTAQYTIPENPDVHERTAHYAIPVIPDVHQWTAQYSSHPRCAWITCAVHHSANPNVHEQFEQCTIAANTDQAQKMDSSQTCQNE